MLRGIHAALPSASNSTVICKHIKKAYILQGVRHTSSAAPGERKAAASRHIVQGSNDVRRAEQRNDRRPEPDHKSRNRRRTPSGSLRYDNTWVESIDFYDWFLNKKLRYERWPLPGAWIPLLDKNSLRRAVPEDLVLDPLAILSRANESPAALENCLELSIAQIESGTDSREERQAQYVRAEPGRRALLWYTEHSHQVDLLLHPRLTRAISHCLFAEQHEGILWRWLGTDDPVLSNPGLCLDERRGWRARLFRDFVEAAAFWSSNSTYMDDSIRVFMSSFDRFRTKNTTKIGPDPMYLPKSGAGTWIVKQLFNGPQSTATEAAFDEVVNCMVRSWVKDLEHQKYTQARLALRHPARPDPYPALQFLQQHQNPDGWSPGIQEIFRPEHQASASATFLFLVMTAQLLNKQGLTAEARWTLDFGRENLTAYFTPGFSRAYETTGNPDISRSVHGRTLQTDPDGRIVKSERHIKATQAFWQIDPRRSIREGLLELDPSPSTKQESPQKTSPFQEQAPSV